MNFKNKQFKYFSILAISIIATICCYIAMAVCFYLMADDPVQVESENIDNIVNNSFESIEGEEVVGQGLPKHWKVTSGCYLQEGFAYDGNRSLLIPKESYSTIHNDESELVPTTQKVYKFGLMFYAEEIEGVKITLSIGGKNDFRTEEIVPKKAGEWVDLSMVFKFEKSFSVGISIDVKAGQTDCFIDNVYISEATPLVTNDDSSIRFSIVDPGLRFTGSVDKRFYDFCKRNYAKVSTGMIIVPLDYVEQVEEFTFKDLAMGGYKLLEIRAEKWNNTNTAAQDGYYGFSCAIVDIMPQNTDRVFCARSYLRYTHNGKETIMYGNFDVENNSSSIYDVAVSLLPNIEEYDKIQRGIINHYANAVTKIHEAEIAKDETFEFSIDLTKGVLKIVADEDAVIQVEQDGVLIEKQEDKVYNITGGNVKITVENSTCIKIKHYINPITEIHEEEIAEGEKFEFTTPITTGVLEIIVDDEAEIEVEQNGEIIEAIEERAFIVMDGNVKITVENSTYIKIKHYLVFDEETFE